MNATEEVCKCENTIRIEELATTRLEMHHRVTERFAAEIFKKAFVAQFFALVAVSIFFSPWTKGESNQTNLAHLLLALLCGGFLSGFPIFFQRKWPESKWNRYVTTCAQILTSVFLIHLCEGRAEAHFHLFASVALLCLYRDWTVFVPATALVAVDLALHDFFGESLSMGIAPTSALTWIEHSIWFALIDLVFIVLTLQGKKAMQSESRQWAELNITKENMNEEIKRQVAQAAQSQLAMKNHDKKLKQIIDSAHDGFVILDSEGAIVYWSERAKELFGWSDAETRGRGLCEVLQCEMVESEIPVGMSLRDLYKTRDVFEVNAKSKRNERMTVEISYFLSKDGHNLEINAFLHDVTRRKMEQSQLNHLRKMESIGQLAAGIAHEINTPSQFIGDNLEFLNDSFNDLSTILHDVESLVQDSEPASIEPSKLEHIREKLEEVDIDFLFEQIPRAIEQAMDGNQRVGAITRAMKEFSHPGTLQPTRINIEQLIENSLIVCRNAWKTEATVKTTYDPAAKTLVCFPSELSQSIINLVVNAAQAISEHRQKVNSAEPGLIQITTRQIDHDIEIRVQDNGPGIPDEIRGRIFDPFFTTKEVGKGTGQGLAITHSAIVERHHGTIDIETEVGKGTTFVLRIPDMSNTQRKEETRTHA